MIRMIKRRFRRRALTGRSLAYYVWRYVINGGRTFRALRRQGTFADAPDVARTIEKDGIIVGRSDDFLTEQGRAALAEASQEVMKRSEAAAVQQQAATQGRSANQTKDFIVYLVAHDEQLPADSPLVRLALDDKLLEIIANYLGFMPRLHAVSAWLNYPTDAEPKVSQLWHRDPEDIKIVKAFIYLVDVDEDCGPFTYIPETQPFGSRTVMLKEMEKRERVSDAQLSELLPPETWRVCTGPKNTMILADTVGFHRGGKPSKGQRILITFTYTSQTPLTGRSFHTDREPQWMTSDLQRYAYVQ